MGVLSAAINERQDIIHRLYRFFDCSIIDFASLPFAFLMSFLAGSDENRRLKSIDYQYI
jgi:hypothetical protein